MKISAIYGPRQKFIFQLFIADNDVVDDNGDNGDEDDYDMDDVENDDVKTCVAQLVVSQPEREMPTLQECKDMQCVDCGWIVDMDKNTETLKQTTEKHGNQNI